MPSKILRSGIADCSLAIEQIAKDEQTFDGVTSKKWNK